MHLLTKSLSFQRMLITQTDFNWRAALGIAGREKGEARCCGEEQSWDTPILFNQKCSPFIQLTHWKYVRFFCFFLFRAYEVPRLGVELELQLPAYITESPDPSCVCNLHHSSWQCWILNPLSEARNRTCILMDTIGSYPAEPQRELPWDFFNDFYFFYYSWFIMFCQFPLSF